MNVVILSNSRKKSGGVERFVWNLHDGLSEKGHHVSILAREDVTGFLSWLMGLASIAGMDQPLLAWVLGRKAAKAGFDVCVTNGMLGWSMRKGRIVNVQHGTFVRGAVRTRQDDAWIKYFIKRYIWSFFEGIAARRATVCVAVSEETKESVVDYYHAKNVTVIPNAIDTDVFVPKDKVTARRNLGLPQDKPIVFFAGRLGSQKAATLIYDIARKIKERNNGCMVVGAVFGQKLPQDSGITGLADFSDGKLVDAYNAADVFLLPSRHEGSSLALLESISCGTPFLASPVGLVPELQKKGLFLECIVETQSADAYLAQLDRLLDMNENEKDERSRALTAYAREYHGLALFLSRYNDLITTI